MADLEELLDEMADEAQEAGFRDFCTVAEVLEQLLAERGDQLPPVQADALQLAADVLYSFDRQARATL